MLLSIESTQISVDNKTSSLQGFFICRQFATKREGSNKYTIHDYVSLVVIIMDMSF